MTVEQYIANLNRRYQLGNATEHSFRADLQNLVETLCPEIQAMNEPKRQACGAPDYILTKNELPIAFIEAKNIGDPDLEGKKKTGNKAQFDRYKASLNHIIFTDYLRFYFYKEGELLEQIAIGKLRDKTIEPIPANFKRFENLLRDFVQLVGTTIKNPNKLAEMMAAKARLLAEVIERALISDEENQTDSSLKDQLIAFQKVLISDITAKTFSDVYAQTITYGMFAARLHDEDLENFSRQKAAELIPKSNPFLRKLFQYIAGYDLDVRIRWIVDDLVQIFLACNVSGVLKNYGRSTQMEDPIIHFYEDFLSAYDPQLRKARGVWYTPAPVVSFIVKAVDDILKQDFDLPLGLADTSKTQIKLDIQGKKVQSEVHKVQILDPATGTGTFLAEVIRQIYKNFENKKGVWSSYVTSDLLPRLNGFELLMASYAMAHLQLDLLLAETGYRSETDERLRIFLTNSLEEASDEVIDLFMTRWLSDEGKQADSIKRDVPVMCVMGNPPYSVSSSNKGAWIQNLIEDYKKNLNERKLNLDDDYIKFIRYGQHFIDKNGSGVLAYISNNSFIDGVTHRQMRKSLLKSFDKIYILDLHGNARKKETAPDGSTDQNVFDIMQGVSINIFVKNKDKKSSKISEVFHYDLYGKRQMKYDFLNKNNLDSIKWTKLKIDEKYAFFVPKDFGLRKSYEKGFKITELFVKYSAGIKTKIDHIAIDFDKEKLSQRISNIITNNLNKKDIRSQYGLSDRTTWEYKSDYNLAFEAEKICKYEYRPFDYRYTYYDNKFLSRARIDVMDSFFMRDNLGMESSRNGDFVFIGKYISDEHYISDNSFRFPLYTYKNYHRENTIFNTKYEHKIQDLQIRLRQARELYEPVKKFYENTVLPFFEHITPATENEAKLFEENQSTYEELKTSVESLEAQLEALQKNKQANNMELGLESEPERKPNLNPQIIKKIVDTLGLDFTAEKNLERRDAFAPIDILDYIYAVLHSPSYREKYKEFLKIDFPRVPYPENAETFWQLVNFGSELRALHLLERPLLEKTDVNYPCEGDNKISRKLTKSSPGFIPKKDNPKIGKVYINETQYFDNVPAVAWEFYIGGYQPAQKWLKDRKGRTLSFDEIAHYQKVITALAETVRVMETLDRIRFV
ncbi:MAG: N-6 DNA methylase [Bernardetiaceae bacterium]|nr:N-6 DNA methylase [Bernardetiaceae bacterium]